MSTQFRDYEEALAPPSLRGPRGLAWFTAHGAHLDELVDRDSAAAAVGLASLAPPDALGPLINERALERAPNEDAAATRARLRAAFDMHAQAGTLPGMTFIMAALGYGVRVVEHYASEPAAWSEFSLFLTPTGFNRPARRWGEAGLKWGDANAYWGLSITDAPRIRAAIRRAKPSHTKCRAAFYVVGNGPGDVWDSAVGSWNDGTTWGYLIPLP